MAVWTRCSRCSKEFSAQEEYLGKKVSCPHCGRRVTVLDAPSLKAAEEEENAREKWQSEQEEKIRT